MRCGDLHDRPQAGSEGPHRRLARAGGQSQFEHADILPPTSLGEIVVPNAYAREGPRGHLGWSRSGIPDRHKGDLFAGVRVEGF